MFARNTHTHNHVPSRTSRKKRGLGLFTVAVLAAGLFPSAQPAYAIPDNEVSPGASCGASVIEDLANSYYLPDGTVLADADSDPRVAGWDSSSSTQTPCRSMRLLNCLKHMICAVQKIQAFKAVR